MSVPVACAAAVEAAVDADTAVEEETASREVVAGFRAPSAFMLLEVSIAGGSHTVSHRQTAVRDDTPDAAVLLNHPGVSIRAP